MRATAALAIAALAVLATMVPLEAMAQGQQAQQATPRVKLRALLGDGYEIKSILLVPADVSTRVARRIDEDGAVLTVQKGAEIATCFFNLRDYVAGTVLDIEWCVPHK
jgi:hypothetical protein